MTEYGNSLEARQESVRFHCAVCQTRISYVLITHFCRNNGVKCSENTVNSENRYATTFGFYRGVVGLVQRRAKLFDYFFRRNDNTRVVYTAVYVYNLNASLEVRLNLYEYVL